MTKEQFIALGLTEEQAIKAAAASGEELKTYIPKHRFDEVNEENKNLKNTVKENTTQLEELKKSTGDSEGLKNQIETLQADNQKKDQEYQEQLKDLKVTNAIKLAIADKAQDTDLVAGLFDKSKLILGDDGKITGLEDQLKSLQESKTFLFKQEETKTETKPQPGFKIGSDGTESNPNQGETMSMKDAITARLQAQIQK
ncbi:phage scaffolding protein [Clostridium algidicarnis]|uniref:phage scaffolding protein n=1 Tax=Clostridium algidicarnis TaxID=37659 RepID=UPI00162A4509|nr:phage scaffolding protein [Clostridium algidicarnis]MBB6696254.1 phage scaffolding protein [Clostridium algidicarnis]